MFGENQKTRILWYTIMIATSLIAIYLFFIMIIQLNQGFINNKMYTSWVRIICVDQSIKHDENMSNSLINKILSDKIMETLIRKAVASGVFAEKVEVRDAVEQLRSSIVVRKITQDNTTVINVGFRYKSALISQSIRGYYINIMYDLNFDNLMIEEGTTLSD